MFIYWHRVAKDVSGVKNRQRKDDEIPPVASTAASIAPSSPGDNEKVNTGKRKESGVKRRPENRNKLKIKHGNKIGKASTMVAQEQKRKANAEEKDTPETQVKKMLKGHTIVLRELRFSAVMGHRKKKKREFLAKIAGTIVNKYRFLGQIKEMASRKALCRKNRPVSVVKVRFATKKKAVVCFLENDENSRILPGKDTPKQCYKNVLSCVLHIEALLDHPSGSSLLMLRTETRVFVQLTKIWHC
ncbi:hypothetical protein PR048_022163 [Dryococelus australis]|uniref:Uncharacterized protein n=1 Tax=Dryococelus australis TaxID=614101 RepID=A0ABQ9H094_9NEOP|nr:hypothetical protein PR048_022163 [Dryococelus australis]